MESIQEIGAIWRGETGRALKSGRAVALVLLFVMAEAVLLTVVGYITTKAAQSLNGGGAGLEQKKQMLSLFTNNSEATIDALAKVPIVLLVAFSATMLFAPMLIALMGFDQLAGEIAPKSMRYLIVRVRRDSIVLGKWLTQVTMLSVMLVLCVVAMVGTAKYLNDDFGWPDALSWGSRLSIAAIVVGVAYASLTALCSTVAGNSALALFLNIITLFAFWIVSLIGANARLPGSDPGLLLTKDESPLAYVRYLVPSEFEHHLLSPAPLEYATGVLAYAGFAAVFLGLALVALKRKDL